MTARRTAPPDRRTAAGAKRTGAPSRKLTGRVAILVRSNGETASGLSVTSGFYEDQDGATVPVAAGNSPVSVQLTGESAPLAVIQVQSAISTLQNDLDSDNEISEMASMQLQMLMDLRSKLLQTASDIEKSVTDTNNAIVGNIK